jgi:hypothetical protein
MLTVVKVCLYSSGQRGILLSFIFKKRLADQRVHLRLEDILFYGAQLLSLLTMIDYILSSIYVLKISSDACTVSNFGTNPKSKERSKYCTVSPCLPFVLW